MRKTISLLVVPTMFALGGTIVLISKSSTVVAAEENPTGSAQIKEQENLSFINIPYFAEGGGFHTTLLLNNGLPEIIQANVTLFGRNAQAFSLPPFNLAPSMSAEDNLSGTSTARGHSSVERK